MYAKIYLMGIHPRKQRRFALCLSLVSQSVMSQDNLAIGCFHRWLVTTAILC